MKILQMYFRQASWTQLRQSDGFNATDCQLVLAFGHRPLLADQVLASYIRGRFPKAHIVWGSTAGEIIGSTVMNESLAITAIQLEKSMIDCALTHIRDAGSSFEAGVRLMQQLSPEGLNGVLVLADGTHINGSELVAGLNSERPTQTSLVGGLAGDGTSFSSTFVGLNDTIGEGYLVALGLYGEITMATGSVGGWDAFGPERTISKSDKNVLYEIDGKNALGLYKDYLGPYAKELPGSAFLFPLALKLEGTGQSLIRTILSIDEDQQSMTFAGNLPQGGRVRLMKANFDRLIEASSEAAQQCVQEMTAEPELAILISCLGRKIVLGDRIEEEIEAARQTLGASSFATGFYSYGEISPIGNRLNCELHNQTMTITTLREN